MSNLDINAEIQSSANRTIEHMVKDVQLIIDNLRYWGDDCGLEFSTAYQELYKNLTAVMDKFNQEEAK